MTTITTRPVVVDPLLEALGLPAGTRVVEWQRPVAQAVLRQDASSWHDVPVTPPAEVTEGALLLVLATLKTGITVTNLNGYTALGESAPVSHSGSEAITYTYRLALFSRQAPAGPVPVPTFTATGPGSDCPWVMLSLTGATAVTSAAFGTVADATAAGTPPLEDTAVRCWAVIGDNQELTVPGAELANTIPAGSQDPAGNSDLGIAVANDDSGDPATVRPERGGAGWMVASLAVAVDPTADETVQTWVTDSSRSAALAGYAVVYGRARATENVPPLQATVQLVRELGAQQLPTVGERFRLAVTRAAGTALGLPAEDWPRFTGEVTDADADTDGRVAVVAVGRRTRALSAPVGDELWPREATDVRVQRILDAVLAQVPDTVLGAVDPTPAEQRRRLPELAAAQQLLDDAVTGTRGQLVEQRDGTLDWHGPDHRRGTMAGVTLDGATELLKPFSSRQSAGDLINDASVTWAAGTVRVTDDDSADLATGLGLHSAEVGTELATAGDAYDLGSELVGRQSRPTWQLPELTVELIRSARAKLVPLLGLRFGDRLKLVNLPAWLPPPTVPDPFVEQLVETFTPDTWQLQLVASDPALSGVALRWIDVPADVTWDSVADDVRWIDAARVVEPDQLLTAPPTYDAGTPADVTTDETLDGGAPATTTYDAELDGGTP